MFQNLKKKIKTFFSKFKIFFSPKKIFSLLLEDSPKKFSKDMIF